MKTNIKHILGLFIVMTLTLVSCSEEEYHLGDLKAPTNIVINTEIVGQDANNPNGDGSGKVNFSVSADNALSYKIDYDASSAIDLVNLPQRVGSHTYTTQGVKIYTVTAVVYGAGGTSSSITKDITVRSDFTAPADIVTALTNDGTKTWVVDQSVPGHMGVGPWEVATVSPIWWSAAVDEKVTAAPCLYSAIFTFTKVAATGTYELTVATPTGAFTKTGSLTTLPGIPATGPEGCYDYPGGTTAFAFASASSGIPAEPSSGSNSPSTQVSILLSGVNTFIGYGAVLKEYEILVIDANYLYLRVQGTETGNAWYIKLKPAP
jgi:hypothetical protein